MKRKKKNFDNRLINFNPETTIQNSEINYSDKKFWNKLKRASKQVGKKTVYFSLLLYYAAKSPTVPKSAKMIVLGALSYLILPVDVIPDFIPAVGLIDDASVIVAAVYKIITHIDDEIRNQAKEKFKQYFNVDDLINIDEKYFGTGK